MQRRDARADLRAARADECRSIGAMAAMVNILVEAHQVPQWLAGAARARTRQGWSGVDEALQMALAA